jgi:hypothetical protein
MKAKILKRIRRINCQLKTEGEASGAKAPEDRAHFYGGAEAPAFRLFGNV